MRATKSTMRVIHISFSSTGGAGGAASYLVKRQRSSDIDASLVSTTSDDLLAIWRRHPATFLSGLLDYFAVRKSESRTLFTLFRATPRQSMSHSPDLVHLHWTPGIVDSQAIEALLQSGTPVVSTLHDFWPLTGGCHFLQGCTKFTSSCHHCPQARRVFHPRVEHAYRNKARLLSHPNHHLIAPSQWMYDLAVTHPSVHSSRLHHIPNLIDLSAFAQPWRHRHHGGPPSSTPLKLGFAAAQINEPRKGLGLLVETCATLRSQGLDIELITAGSGRQRERHPWWHHFGSLHSKSELLEFYSQCDLLVVPSFEDNAPTVLLEAGLSGIPVVAPGNSGAPEFIKHGWSGFICDSVDRLQATLTLAHEKRDSLPIFGERLQRDLQDALNEDRIMSQFLALYERCVAHGAGSDSG